MKKLQVVRDPLCQFLFSVTLKDDDWNNFVIQTADLLDVEDSEIYQFISEDQLVVDESFVLPSWLKGKQVVSINEFLNALRYNQTINDTNFDYTLIEPYNCYCDNFNDYKLLEDFLLDYQGRYNPKDYVVGVIGENSERYPIDYNLIWNDWIKGGMIWTAKGHIFLNW